MTVQLTRYFFIDTICNFTVFILIRSVSSAGAGIVIGSVAIMARSAVDALDVRGGVGAKGDWTLTLRDNGRCRGLTKLGNHWLNKCSSVLHRPYSNRCAHQDSSIPFGTSATT